VRVSSRSLSERPAVAPIRIDIKLRGFEPLLIFLDGRQSIAILRCKMLQRLRVSVHISKYLEEPSASLVRGFNSQVYEVLERRQNKDQKPGPNRGSNGCELSSKPMSQKAPTELISNRVLRTLRRRSGRTRRLRPPMSAWQTYMTHSARFLSALSPVKYVQKY